MHFSNILHNTQYFFLSYQRKGKLTRQAHAILEFWKNGEEETVEKLVEVTI